MQITKINIPASNGLEDIKMDKLSNLVLIAGKNGSGKSRILNTIVQTIQVKPKLSDVEKLQGDIQQNQQNIINFRGTIASFEQELLLNPSKKASIEAQIKNYHKHIENSLHQISVSEAQDIWKKIETNELGNHYNSIFFVPKDLRIEDPNQMPPKQMIVAANAINNAGMNTLSKGAFAKIQHIQDIWFNATHPQSNLTKEEKYNAIQDYEKLVDLIKTFFNTEIERSKENYATIFGFELANANLSNGQVILMQLCLAIYSQEVSLKDLILLMDEPENHLHPSVIIEIIDKILVSIPNGQLWIATHSIPLLAHFDPSKIWYIENGKIEYAGKIPEKVLTSLLGDENEIQKLQDFISLPAQLATNIYAFQSLFEPHAVTTGATDPQSIQIRSNLLKASSNGKLRILDYGAGKGRLIQGKRI
jgi:predicted ATPase